MNLPPRSLTVAASALGVAAAALTFAGIAHVQRSGCEAEPERERARLTTQLARAEQALTLPAPLAETTARQWCLLDSAEVATTLQVVQTLVDASGVTLLSAKATPSSSGGRQTFLLTGRARPQQLCELLASIERHDRLMVVETGRVVPGDEAQVDFELGLATWHRDGGAR